MAETVRILAGTSGYSYKQWKGAFYPAKLPAAKMLGYYAERLPCVELNSTFYRLPKPSVVEQWATVVPDTFRFAVKASRRITHLKRLKDVGEETAYLLDVLSAFGPKLGVLLVQLPPQLKKDRDRLEAFLALPCGDVRLAFEFRHPSWLDDDVLDLLRARNAALCIADVDDEPEPTVVATTDFGYVRLRRAEYDDAAVGRWRERVRSQPWRECFVFFKHEDAGVGPRLAATMLAG